MPVLVTLTPTESRAAILTGAERQIDALTRGLRDRAGTSDDTWTLHIEGAAGEMAAAKALGRYWQMPVSTFKKGGDVGELQIRTRSQHNYDLIVRDDDRDGDLFVLVTGRIPRFAVHGWIRGGDAKRAEWRKQYDAHEPAFFVPQGELRPLVELESPVR
jgi:hypothetical protein